MEAILKFNLDDTYDTRAHLRCVKALDAYLALWELQEKFFAIRNSLLEKDESEELAKEHSAFKEIYDFFFEELEKQHINLDSEIE